MKIFSGNIMFLDIETAPLFRSFETVPVEMQYLWEKKAAALLRNNREETGAADIYNKAGIYAEFGKVICISCGVFQQQGDEPKKLIIKSFTEDDEAILLQKFVAMLNSWDNGNRYLCAHNGKEFDFPYLCRRMIIHQINLPALLNIQGRKPWDVPHLDTMEMWKFGDYKSYTSLELLAYTLGVTSPKDDIDGSQVAEVYWQQGDLNRIIQYCQKDVVTIAQVYLRLQGDTLVKENDIELKA